MYALNILLPGICMLVALSQDDYKDIAVQFLRNNTQYALLLKFETHILYVTGCFWPLAAYYAVAFSGSVISVIGVVEFLLILHSLYGRGIASIRSSINVRRVTAALALQISPTLLCYSLSGFYIAQVIIHKIAFKHTQVLNDLAVFCYASHNFLSVLFAIALTEEYRTFLLTSLRLAIHRVNIRPAPSVSAPPSDILLRDVRLSV